MPKRVTWVDNAPLRERFLESGANQFRVALSCAWGTTGKPDGSRVLRSLGLKDVAEPNARGSYYRRTRIKEAEALALMEALGLDPHEIGL